jgi:UDP-glucose 4-epimerase
MVTPSSLVFPAPAGSGVALVTGAAGFIGQHVAMALRRGGWTVGAIGHARPGIEAAFAAAGIDWWPCAVSADALRTAVGHMGAPELVIHAAGGASVGESLADPQRDHGRSVASTRAVLEALRTLSGGPRFVLLSSAAVYGTGLPMVEDRPLSPLSPYGRHKQMAEDLVRRAAVDDGLDTAVVRLFSVYGPGIRKQLLWELARRLLARPTDITLYGQGDETRDFLFVDDAVAVLGCLAQAPRSATTRIVNGGTGRPVTVRALAETLCQALGVTTRIAFNGEVRAGDPKTMVADMQRAAALGFAPVVPIEDGIPRFATWAKAELCATG